MNTPDISNNFALDSRGLNTLQGQARQNSPEAAKAAATQFEALFLNMVMKSMREATPQDGMFGSEQTKTFTGMLDQQLTQNLAKRGVGMADMMMKQMTRHGAVAPVAGAEGATPAGMNSPLAALNAAALDAGVVLPEGVTARVSASGQFTGLDAAGLAAAGKGGRPKSAHVQAFTDKLAGYADQASRATGVPAKFMLGQAALESGWGKRQIVAPDGTPSNNLFGIKAGPSWKGKVVEAVTTEYVNGQPVTKRERFRAYDTPADSFADYAKMLKNNPRYENVLAHTTDAASFARGLQRAGYATDPMYAAKLTRIINHTLA
jgi:flagellar protein FlgJ